MLVENIMLTVHMRRNKRTCLNGTPTLCCEYRQRNRHLYRTVALQVGELFGGREGGRARRALQ